MFSPKLEVELVKTSDSINTLVINNRLPKKNNAIEGISIYLEEEFLNDGFRINKLNRINKKLSFKELSERILIELNKSDEFKIFIRNKIKTWKSWSFLLNNIWLFSQGEDVSDKIKKGDRNLSTSSWFTINEYNKLNNLLDNFNETIYNRFNELRLIERKIHLNIFNWMELDIFWEDVTKYIQEFLNSNFKTDFGYLYNWYYYKGCLLTEEEYNNLINNNIPSNIKSKEEYYYREDYFDIQFDWINQNDYIIERNLDSLKNNINNSENFYGIDLFEFFRMIEKITKNRKELEELLLLNKIESHSLSNYDNINLELFFPILLGFKYREDLFTIDDNFFDKLKLNYNFDSEILFGLIEENDGDNKLININQLQNYTMDTEICYQDLSYGKKTIVNYNFNSETKSLEKKLYNYQVVGKNIFGYKIYLNDLVEDNTIFYQLDFLDGEKIKFDQIIDNHHFDSNIINFKLDENIFDETSISLRGYQHFDVKSCKLIGRIMELKFLKDLMVRINSNLFSRMKFKYNQEFLKAKNDTITDLDKMNFIVPNNLQNMDYLIVSCLFYLRKTEIRGNKKYLYFESSFDDFWNSEIGNSSGIYIKLDNQIIKLNQEISSNNQVLSYIDSSKELSLSVEVFKYQEIESISQSQSRNYEIIFSGNFREELMIHNTFINNISLFFDETKIEYQKMEVLDTNKIDIVTEKLLNNKPNKIQYYFNLGESIPFSINNISTDNSLLYLVNYSINIRDNMEIKVKDDNNNYFNIVGELVEVVDSISKIVFWNNSTNINLLDRPIHLVTTYNITNYTVIDGKLNWIPSTDFELNMNDEFVYQLNGVTINKVNISFDKNIVIIDNLIESDNYQLVETNNPSNKLYLPENNKPIILELDELEKWTNYESYQIKSIDNYGSEIGNYLYKVKSRNVLEINISGSGTNYILDDYTNNNIVKKGWYVYHQDLPFGTKVVNLIEPNQIVLSNGFESAVSNKAVKILFLPDNNKIVLSYNNEKIGNNYFDRIKNNNNITGQIYKWIVEEDIMVFTFVVDKKLEINPDILKVNRNNELFTINFTEIEYISEMLFKPSYYHNISTKRLKYLNQQDENYNIDNRIILFFPSHYTSNNFIGSSNNLQLKKIVSVLSGRSFNLKLENQFKNELKSKIENSSQVKTVNTIYKEVSYEDPKFIDNLSFNLIKSIHFFIGDQLIETIDDWWNYLNYNWNKNENEKNKYNKISNISLKNDNKEITIELPFGSLKKNPQIYH